MNGLLLCLTICFFAWLVFGGDEQPPNIKP